MQFTEDAREPLVFLGSDVLVAEDEDVVGLERVLEFLLLLGRQLLGQVETGDLRPEHRGDRGDGQGLVGLGGAGGEPLDGLERVLLHEGPPWCVVSGGVAG